MIKEIKISDLRSDSGFYPVDNDGIWHSGIHISKNEGEEIQSPVNGKIIAANLETENEDKDNYYWISEELKIPVKGNTTKTINSYSLLSNIKSYKEYKSYTKSAISIKDYNKNIFSENGNLPFGIKAYINLNLYNVPYLEFFNEKKFLNSTYYENFGTGLSKKIGIYTPKTETQHLEINFKHDDVDVKAFITSMLKVDGIECPEWTVGHIDSGYFIPDNNSRLKLDENEFKTGYIFVDGKNLSIDASDNIEFNCPEFFIESDDISSLSGFKLVIIRKNDKNKINEILQSIIAEIKEVEKNGSDTLRELKSVITDLEGINKKKLSTSEKKQLKTKLEQQKKNLEQQAINNSRESLKLYEEKYLADFLIKKFESENIQSILIALKELFSLSANIIYNPNSDYSTNTKSYLYKKNPNKLEIFNTNETIIKQKFINLSYSELLKKFKKYNVSYTECSPNDFSDLTKQKYKSKMITGLKVIYTGKEENKKIGVFKCKPWLLTYTKYNGYYQFPFKKDDYENVYRRQKITSFGTTHTKSDIKGVLLFSDSDVKYTDDYSYNKEPIKILTGEAEILNVYDLINQNIKKDSDGNETIQIDDNHYYKCKLNCGYAFIKGKDLKIKLIIEQNNNLINKQISKNTFLGYVRKNKPYLDWSTFFYDDLLEIEPEKISLIIPGGIQCKKIEKPYKQIFLTNNTYIKTSSVKSKSNLAKLEEIRVVITIYSDDNKDCVELDQKNTLKCKDTINEIYFYCHSFEYKKNLETGEVKLVGGKNFSNYTKDALSIETDEVKIFAEKIILPKLLNQTIKWEKHGWTGGHSDPTSYQFTIKIKPEEIADAYDFNCPLYIDRNSISLSLDNTRNYGKGQIFTVYNDEENEIDALIPTNADGQPVYCNENYVESKDDLYVEVDGIKYKIDNKQIEEYKTDILKDYWQKLIPLNYKYKGYTQITDEKICPSDSLLCKVKELKEKLKEFKEAENEIFAEYLDYDKNGVGSNRIYKMDAYKPALKAGLNRLIAYHPLEFDKELHSDLMKTVLPHLQVEEFSDETDNDIATELPIKEENTNKEIKENKFYFVFPLLFDEVIEKSKIRDFNPYELAGITSYKVEGKTFEIKNNPGFMPEGTSSNSFTQEFNADATDTYSHEGVDIAVPNAAIISGISGKVIVEGDKDNYSYGCFIVIQANEKYDGKYRYYLLAHLDRNKPHKTEDKQNNQVYPNDIVGYVGNTGHCKSGGINIEGPDNLDLRKKGKGAHLHLQMFLTDSPAENFIDIMNFDNLKNKKTKESKIQCSDRNIVNPFDYSEKYEKDTKK